MRRTVGTLAGLLSLSATQEAWGQQGAGSPPPAAAATSTASTDVGSTGFTQQSGAGTPPPPAGQQQVYPTPGYPPPVQPQPYPQPYQPQPYPQQPYPQQPGYSPPYAPVQPQPAPGWPQATEAQPQPPAGWQQPMSPTLAPPPVEASPAPATGEVGVGEDDRRPWTEKLTLSAFVDGYASVNFLTPRPQDGRNRFRAFDDSNGFSLAWVGVNGRYGTDEVSGTLDLRFGPAATALAKGDANNGLSNVKQAFATWRPGGKEGKVTLDFGKFDSIYGAEMAESHSNFNYTRGLVFWLTQPMFHTGLRAAVDVSPNFWVTGLVANGWNNSLDNNLGKTLGLQLSASVPRGNESSLLDVHLGYLTGPEQVDYGTLLYCAGPGEGFNPETGRCDTNFAGSTPYVLRDAGGSNNFEAFRHLIDLVVNLTPAESLAVLFNANLGFEGVRQGSVDQFGTPPGFGSESWWSVSAAARYAFSPVWAGALRAEMLGDADGRVTPGDELYVNRVKDLFLYSATMTVEAAPTRNLLLRLDARLDGANESVFPRLLRRYEQVQPTVTFGVVAKTD